MSDKAYVFGRGTYFFRKTSCSIEVKKEGEKTSSLSSDETECFQIDHETSRLFATKPMGTRRPLWVYTHKQKRILAWPGGSMELEALDLTEGAADAAGQLKPLKLTMPGKVLSIKVKVGDIVEQGQALLVIEAMKMENLLLSPAKAKVAKIHVEMGARLESGTILVTFEPVA